MNIETLPNNKSLNLKYSNFLVFRFLERFLTIQKLRLKISKEIF